MRLRSIRAAAVVASLTLAPSALAFDSVDAMLWPSDGAFRAYPGEPRGLWGLRAFAGLMYDDNVLRTDDAIVGRRSDTISRLGLGGTYAQRVYGRQSVVLEAVGEYRDYDRFDELDHWAYATRADWLWEFTNELSGAAGWRRTQRLADLGESRVPEREIVIEDRFDITGVWAFGARWRAPFGIGWVHVDRDGRTDERTNAWVARGGIEHVSGLGNTIGVEARYGEGDAAVDDLVVGFFPANRYQETELAATIAYRVTPDMRLRGRLGYTTREYTDLPVSGFEGTTGRGLFEWRPSAKTLFLFEIYRSVDPLVDVEAAHVDRRGAVVGLSWAATLKLVFGTRFTQERRLYEGTTGELLLGIPARDETLRFMSFTAGWEFERHWQLAAAIDYGERESNIFGTNYDYTAYTLNLTYQFR